MDTKTKTDAAESLRKAGFSEMGIAMVMRSAHKNRREPVAYAKRAIRLRAHITAGKPL